MSIPNSIKLVFLSFFMISFLSSCNNAEFNAADLKPKSRNEMGELLVVLDKEHWEGLINDSLKSNFGEYITTTPLPYEPEFDLEYVDKNGLNKIIKRYKTILIININSGFKSNLSFPVYDMWAKNQIIYKLDASSVKNAATFISSKSAIIKQGISSFYQKNIISSFEDDNEINKKVKEEHQLVLSLPSKMKIKKSKNNFTWLNMLKIRQDNNGDHEIQQGLFIYSYPYTDKNIFSIEKQIQIRDSILKRHVHGKEIDSYMKTRSDNLAIAKSKSFKRKGKDIFEVRGLWKMVNDKMGGSFISLSTYDEPRKRIVTIEGYVYAPNFGKRELIRELEAIIYSFRFICLQ